MMLEFPLRLHPCRLCHGNSEILDLIEGASAAMPLYSSFSFSLSDRASTVS